MHILIRVAVLLAAACQTACVIHNSKSERDTGKRVCGLLSMPSAAKRTPTHGVDFYVYPVRISSSYYGCQILWLEDGTRLAVARYVKGRVASFELNEPKGKAVHCVYSNDPSINIAIQASGGDVGDCPNAERFPL